MRLKADGKNSTVIFITAWTALVLCAVLSLFAGKYHLGIPQVFNALVGKGDRAAVTVVRTLRLSRTLMGIISGAALGLAGCVYQTVFRNPLASPDLIGVAGGANLGAAAAIVIGAGASAFVMLGAFAGGAAAVVLVMLLASVSGRKNISYILGGIIINALSSAGVMALKFFADPENQLVSIEYWEMGTLGTVTFAKFFMAFIPVMLGIIGLILLSRQITLLSLGEDESKTLGVRINLIRILVLGLNTLIVACSVSVTGLIAFVGLIAPHIAGLLIKKQGRSKMLLSAVIGAITVVAADVLARTVYSYELPLSILTTVIGVPVLVWLMLKRREG